MAAWLAEYQAQVVPLPLPAQSCNAGLPPGYGQIGDGTRNTAWNPVPVPGLSGIVAVAAGYGHTLALRRDGTVMAWGDNVDGELGTGRTGDQLNPAAIPGLTQVVALRAGERWSLALRSDGSLVTWGWNNHGQLGNGTFATRTAPALVIDQGRVWPMDLDRDGRLQPDVGSVPPFITLTYREGGLNAINLAVELFSPPSGGFGAATGAFASGYNVYVVAA